MFVEFISGLIPRGAAIELYRSILDDACGVVKQNNRQEVDKLQKEAERIQERKDKVNDLYFDGEISKEDREEQLCRYNDTLKDLSQRIKVLRTCEELDINDKLNYGINIVENLPRFFSTASTETKVRLLGSIFSQEIVFDGKFYRTNSVNSILGCIYENINLLQGQTETDSPDLSGKSACVAPRGIEPRFKV